MTTHRNFFMILSKSNLEESTMIDLWFFRKIRRQRLSSMILWQRKVFYEVRFCIIRWMYLPQFRLLGGLTCMNERLFSA